MALSAYAGRVFDGTVRGYRLVDDNYFYYNCLTGEAACREFSGGYFCGAFFNLATTLVQESTPTAVALPT